MIPRRNTDGKIIQNKPATEFETIQPTPKVDQMSNLNRPYRDPIQEIEESKEGAKKPIEVNFILTDNHKDLPLPFVNKTYQFLKQGKRYFGKAGSGLSNQLTDPKYKEFKINAKAIRAGIAGEISTSQALRKWMVGKPNVILVDSIHLKLNGEDDEQEFDEEESQVNTLGDTDHLLIIGSSIVLIDSKNWKEKASYSVTNEGEVMRSKHPFPGNKPKVNQNKYLWKKFYENSPIDSISSFVCISNPTSFIIRDRAWWMPGWKLVNQETLVYFLDKLYNETISDKETIYVDVVAKALTGLQKPYDVYKAQFSSVYDLVVR